MRSWRRTTVILLLLAGAGGCGGEGGCRDCGAAAIAATGEPRSLLPPLVVETVGRDVSDQVFERLADLAPGAATIDTTAYRPRLAERWERLDGLRWRFRIRPGARWHDGRPVTARDVAFSFAAFADPALGAPAQAAVAGLEVEVEDSLSVVLRFPRSYPEQLYDATYHVRVLPSHVWDTIPRAAWALDTALARLVGSGPYRVAEWRRGEFLRLDAVTPGGTAAGGPALSSLIWRFASDQDAALTMVLGRQADLLETVTSPDRIRRVEEDPALDLVAYPSAVYGFLGFRVGGEGAGGPLRDRAVRRGLAMAVDRQTLAAAVFGPEAVAPPGPMSRLLWIWSDSIAVLPHDTAAAGRALDAAGWPRSADGLRRRAGAALALDILVPSTSPSRRRLAIALGDAWRSQGVTVTITAVDFPVFQERLRGGRFDAYIGAWLDEPSPRGLADQWTRTGWGGLNHARYANPRFDALVGRALQTADPSAAKRLWREAIDTLNADAPAIFLYTPMQRAVVARRLRGLSLDPYSWLSGVARWRPDAAGSAGAVSAERP